MKTTPPSLVTIGFAIGLFAGVPGFSPPSAAAADANSLQALIDTAPAGGVVAVPDGTWDQPLVIAKPVTLRGGSAATCVVSVRADVPAVRITAREPVVIEGLTIRWERATSERASEPQAAVFLRDATATLRRCRLEAPGGNTRCPSGVHAAGFTDLKLEGVEVRGFEYAVNFWEGAKGVVTDCAIVNPGHCGITVGNDSEAEVGRSVVTGSAFHGLRCTGGVLRAHDNLVIRNKNRGFYLGNRSARGEIRNNVILGNATGVSGFAQSDVVVANNVILDSEYAGLDARDTCRLRVTGNIVADNARGLVVFKESGANRNRITGNLVWNNRTEFDGLDPLPASVRVEPKFKDRAAGEFALINADEVGKGIGLTHTEPLTALWAKWQQLEPLVK